MKNLLFTLLFFLISSSLFAQVDRIFYTASALNLRSTPDVKGAVLEKVPFGAVVKWEYDSSDVSYGAVYVDEFETHWQMVSYNGKKGYLSAAYLLPFKPVEKSVQSIEDLANALGKPFGQKLTKTQNENQEFEISYTRQLYDNGHVLSITRGWEYFAETLLIEDIDVLQAYQLVKQVKDLTEVFALNKTLKPGEYKFRGKDDEEHIWKTEYSEYNKGRKYLTGLKVGWESGGYSNLTILQVENGVVIALSTGT